MKPDVRDRLVLPLLIPVVLLLIVAAVAVAFGMILFFNPIEVSLTIAIVVAGAILAAFGMASSKREDELNRPKRAVIAFAGVAPLVVGLLVAVNVLDTSSEKVAERECHFCIPEDAFELTGVNLTFDPDTMELPAAGEVSILFRNQDAGVEHNVFIYPYGADGTPLTDEPIFEGDTFPGVGQMVYTFEAPEEPGEYYFNCTIHPTTMTGNVVFGG